MSLHWYVSLEFLKKIVPFHLLFRWPEIVQIIMKQQGDTRDFEYHTWNDKCKILQSNPVTVARMFDNRFHTFLQKVTLSTSEPIGKVIYYFYRIEFKRRGSPHTYCLFCLENPHSSEKIPKLVKFDINTKTKNYIILSWLCNKTVKIMLQERNRLQIQFPKTILIPQ